MGAGCGSIARWLADRVAADGHVVATDIDTGLLDSGGRSNLEVIRHDITTDEWAERSFDLVHARMVVAHLPDRGRVISRMVSALRPGGWAFIEDFDWLTPILTSPSRSFTHPESKRRLFARVSSGILKFLRALGVEPDYGRRLPGDVIAAGLEEVGAEGRSLLIRRDSPGADFFHLSLEQLRVQLVTLGFLTEREVERALDSADEDDWAFMSPVLVGAWGRRSLEGMA